MSAPGALIFDVFGTCVDWRSSIARQVATLLPQVDPVAFADAWRAEYQPAMKRIRDGHRGYVPLDDLHLENLVEVLDKFDVTLDDAPQAARAWEQLDPWPDVVTGLQDIARKAIVAPCSNGSIALMTHLSRYAGLPWSCILGAELAQDYKPQPAVYLAACKALRLPTDQVMMVAAHNDDLVAARAAGLLTAFVPRPEEHGRAQKTDLVPSHSWDVIASDFHDLARHI